MAEVALAHEQLPGSGAQGGSYAASLVRGFGRHPVVVLGIVLLVAAGPVLWQVRVHSTGSPAAAPAELFMQSVATLDGDLGWNQLCPAVQAQVPRALVLEQTGAQRLAASEQGMTLSIDHVGDRARASGGQIRFYVATAHSADGSVGQKTYIIKTQASGCVESVE